MARMRYEPPTLVDYGDLVRMTEAMHPKLAMSAVSDLSFSSANGIQGTAASSPGGLGPGGSQPSVAASPSHGLTGGSGPGTAGGGGAGATGGGGGGGGTLPFTGLAAGLVAALGSGLVAGGTALRRRLRR